MSVNSVNIGILYLWVIMTYRMDETPAVVTSSSILTNPDCSTLSTSIQSCSAAEVPSELVVVTHKIVKFDNKQTELVIGKEIFIPLYFSPGGHKNIAK